MSRPRGARPLRISEVAERFEVHPQTLRLYERHGLLRPGRSRGNTRCYGAEDLARLRTILTLSRDLGVNLAGIEVILHMRRRMDAMMEDLDRLTEFLAAELSRTRTEASSLALVPRPPGSVAGVRTVPR